MPRKTPQRHRQEIRQAMGEVLSLTIRIIQNGMSNGTVNAFKEIAFVQAMKKLPLELLELAQREGQRFSLTGDNWQDDPKDPKRSVFPYPTASVAFTQLDKNGNILAVAMAPVMGWERRLIVADADGVWDGRVDEEMRAQLSLIKEVEQVFLAVPPTAQVFGQKPKPHWVAMNSLVGELNAVGIRTTNDCGPYFALRDWFGYHSEGLIVPRNMVYIEPYSNKFKEELMAFVVRKLNRNLPAGQKFVMTDMSGEPLFSGDRLKRVAEGTYSASGYIISPTKSGHKQVLDAIATAVCVVGAVEISTSQMMRLADNLARWRAR